MSGVLLLSRRDVARRDGWSTARAFSFLPEPYGWSEYAERFPWLETNHFDSRWIHHTNRFFARWDKGAVEDAETSAGWRRWAGHYDNEAARSDERVAADRLADGREHLRALCYQNDFGLGLSEAEVSTLRAQTGLTEKEVRRVHALTVRQRFGIGARVQRLAYSHGFDADLAYAVFGASA